MKLIFLFGPPASGKLTVARRLAERTGLPVFHNHLAVDAVASVFPFGSEPFVRLRELYWLAMFEAAAREGRSLIFTFAPEPSVAADFPGRAAALVAAHGGSVDFVRLVVAAEEQERRLAEPGRSEFGKLTSVELLRTLREGFERCEAMMPPARLTLDTAALAPDEAAERILEALGLAREGQVVNP